MFFDAVVIGAGPAGASAALGLLRKGLSVAIFEQRPQILPRVCGSFLNPEAVRHLRWLGVPDQNLINHSTPVCQARITLNSGEWKTIKVGEEGTSGLATQRSTLEEILLDKVRQAGGVIDFGSRVRGYKKGSRGWELNIQKVGLNPCGSSHLIFADGRYSMNNPQRHKIQTGWYGWNATFHGANQNPGDLSLHFYPGGYVGVLTFKNGESNVCGLVSKLFSPKFSWDDVFREAIHSQPHLKNLLRNSQRISPWRGVGPLPFSKTMGPTEEAFLVGDAAAVGDPFMGEGIGRALGAGPLLYQAFSENLPFLSSKEVVSRYKKNWMRVYSSRLLLGNLVRKGMEYPRLFPTVLRFFMNQPWTINNLIPQFHRGYVAPHFVKALIKN